MHPIALVTFLMTVGAFAFPQSLGGGGGGGNSPTKGLCTRQRRLQGARLIIRSYNQVSEKKVTAGFNRLPVADDCLTQIYANNSPVPITVAVDGTGTRDFAIESRQAFSKVTGTYTDFTNGTSVIHTNVTLGADHQIGLPATFYANVYLFYDLENCLMQKIFAYADIPTVLLGKAIHPPKIPS